MSSLPLLPARQPADPALAQAVQRLRRTSVLVVGDVMLDRYIYGSVSRISSEAPVPIVAIEREVVMPGGAGNVVRNLSALGAGIAFVSIVGDDQPGSDLTGLIGGQPGVEPWLLVQGGRVTTRKTRYVARGQQVLRADREQTDPIHPKLAERMLRIACDAMAATSVTILSDYGKGVLANGIPAALIAAARQAGRRILVDPRGSDYAAYAGADLLTPTWRELAGATLMATDTDAEVVAAAAALRASHRIGGVLVLRGEAGMTLVCEAGEYHYATELGEVFDLFGTNDTVIATVAAGLAAGLSLPQAAELANLAIGIVAAKVGSAVAQAAELLAVLGE